MMLNIVALATFFFTRAYFTGEHLSRMLVKTFVTAAGTTETSQRVAATVMVDIDLALQKPLSIQTARDDAEESQDAIDADVDAETVGDNQSAAPIMTLAHFRARVRTELIAWAVFELLALASVVPFSIFHHDESSSVLCTRAHW